MITVVRAGMATTIQDRGRRGQAADGVPPSGAVDPELAALVNRLVGNEPGAAVVETAGGLRVRCDVAASVAATSELVTRTVVAGTEVSVEPLPGEMWGYLAVRGGIAVEPVLGSRSHDTLSGLGPPAVADGTRLPIGTAGRRPLSAEQAIRRLPPSPVTVWPGPRADWFEGEVWALTGEPWVVSGDVSRVGIRLDGAPIARRRTGELPSEGLVTGAIQVPPNGRPVVMLADHPTTGGYPVIAVVDPASLATVVQARPGSVLGMVLRR